MRGQRSHAHISAATLCAITPTKANHNAAEITKGPIIEASLGTLLKPRSPAASASALYLLRASLDTAKAQHARHLTGPRSRRAPIDAHGLLDVVASCPCLGLTGCILGAGHAGDHRPRCVPATCAVLSDFRVGASCLAAPPQTLEMPPLLMALKQHYWLPSALMSFSQARPT